MKYKLNSAIKKCKLFGREFDAKHFFGMFLFVATVLLFVLARRYAGSWWAPFRWWWELFGFIWREGERYSLAGVLLLCFFTFYLVFFLLSYIYDFLTSHLRENVPLDKDGPFTGIDFQSTDFILQRKNPVILPYDQTTMRLVIYLQRNEYQNNVREDVFMLRLCFTHQKDSYTCLNFCGMEGIFPLLNYVTRFSLFSYEFNDPFQEHQKNGFPDFLRGQQGDQLSNNRAPKNSPLRNYQNFIEEQIQNYLHYGVYLPYSPREMNITRKFFLLLSLIFAPLLIIFLCFGNIRTLMEDPLFTLVCLSPALLPGIIWAWLALRYIRYYKSKRKLKQFKK